MTEADYWKKLVVELQERVTIERIAKECGASSRDVWWWKAGRKPSGMRAVKLYLFHMKLCPEIRCDLGQIVRA